MLKNIDFDFGYYGHTKWQKFTHKICEKFKLFTFEVKLFRTYSYKDEFFPIKHEISFNSHNWQKVKGKWNYRKL